MIKLSALFKRSMRKAAAAARRDHSQPGRGVSVRRSVVSAVTVAIATVATTVSAAAAPGGSPEGQTSWPVVPQLHWQPCGGGAPFRAHALGHRHVARRGEAALLSAARSGAEGDDHVSGRDGQRAVI